MSELGGYQQHQERFSPGVEALISALMSVPVVVVMYAQPLLIEPVLNAGLSLTAMTLWTIAINSLLPLCFVVIVAFRARRERRAIAVCFAVAVMAFSVGFTAANMFFFQIGYPSWVFAVVTVVLVVGWVAVWGVARRRNRIWLLGLVAAVIFGVIERWVHLALPVKVFVGPPGWVAAAALYLGGLVPPCLICWGLDALGDRSQRATTPEIPGR